MNLLEVTNKVLKRLREDQVSATDESDYSTLIAEFVADIHSECVEEHDWSSMFHYIDVELHAGQRQYNLSRVLALGGSVPNDQRVTNHYSHLIFDKNNRPMAYLFDDENDTQGEQVFHEAQSDMDTQFQFDRALENLQPCHISYVMDPNDDGLLLTVWPLPQADRLLRLKFWTPTVLLADGSDDLTDLMIPYRPVYLGALMMALNERGEELGEPGNVAEQRYLKARSSAIEADMKANIRADQYEVERD